MESSHQTFRHKKTGQVRIVEGLRPGDVVAYDPSIEEPINATPNPANDKKYDGGKPPIFRGLASYFPRALTAVAEVSAFGFQKYKSWGGWVDVVDGDKRYADALFRHSIQRAGGEVFDQESKLRHAAQAAWNALAVLELELRAAEKDKVS